MIKTTHPITIPYTYDPNRKGAHYTINGTDYMNHGQFVQIALVASLYNRIDRPDHVAYNVDSDIPELHESVKSSKATLVNAFLGNDFETVLNAFFENVASTQFSWCILLENEIVRYVMNKNEFRKFTETFATFDNSRKVIRYKITSTKMIQYLENGL